MRNLRDMAHGLDIHLEQSQETDDAAQDRAPAPYVYTAIEEFNRPLAFVDPAQVVWWSKPRHSRLKSLSWGERGAGDVGAGEAVSHGGVGSHHGYHRCRVRPRRTGAVADRAPRWTAGRGRGRGHPSTCTTSSRRTGSRSGSEVGGAKKRRRCCSRPISQKSSLHPASKTFSPCRLQFSDVAELLIIRI